MIIFISSFFIIQLVYFIIGYYPSKYIFKCRFKNITREQQTILIFSPILGLIILTSAAYFISKALNSGVFLIGPIVTVSLILLAALATLLNSEERQFFLSLISEQRGFLLAALLFLAPLSCAHLTWAMINYDWQFAYSISTDGAAYTYLIEFLQNNFWGPGKSLVNMVPMPYIGRPLTSYMPAIAYSILPINIFQSQTLTCMNFSFYCALLMGWLGKNIFEYKENYSPYIIAAICFGIFSFHASLYWDKSYLSHYYSALPFLLTTVPFFISADKYLKKFLLLSVIFITSIGIYTLGLAIIQTIIIFTIIFTLMLSKKVNIKNIFYDSLIVILALSTALLIFYSTESAFFIGNLDRGYSPNLKSWENVFYKFGITMFSDTKLSGWAFLSSALMVIALFIYSAHKCIVNFKTYPIFPGYLLGILFIIIAAIFKDKFFFINKSLFYLFIVIIIPIISDFNLKFQKTGNFIKIFLGIIFINLIISGTHSISFFYDVARGRDSFVTAEKINLARDLFITGESKKIFSVDNLLERHLLNRVIFSKFEWQPNLNEFVSPEFGINSKSPPINFLKYEYDLLAIGDSDMDPVDYSQNDAWAISAFPGLKLYSREASAIDFDYKWVTSQSQNGDGNYIKTTSLEDSKIYFINGGYHKSLSIEFEIQGDSISTPTKNTQPLIKVNGVIFKNKIPGIIEINCPTICQMRVNSISLSPKDNTYLIIKSIRFSK